MGFAPGNGLHYSPTRFMKFRPHSASSIVIFCSLAMGWAGCKKPRIRVYLAPKEVPVAAAAEVPPVPEESAPPRPKPQLTYTLPAGWSEAQVNSVSVAGFAIKAGDAEANVAITPLPNLAGREGLVVNMWREQAGLPPIESAELAKTLEPVEIGGKKGQMFEVLGARDGGKPLRIVTAFYHEDQASWFYKLAGDEALVSAQKPVFVEFLKSVRVKEGTAPATDATSVPPPPEFKWKVPDGWQTLPPGNMQVGKFAVPEKDGGKGEVSVSIFPNDTGGTLANVNRWRQQLGLPAIEDAGLAGLIAPLDPTTPDAVLVDLKSDSRALLGAIVPREGRWWFYKMLGDTPAVSAARDSFIAFAKTQP